MIVPTADYGSADCMYPYFWQPNCATAGAKSQDRTEPTAGAKVLLELYRKYQDRWLVELLFDDLLDANNWAVRERTRAPLGLIALGTSTSQFAYKSGSTTEFSCDRSDQNTGCMQAMQNSRYESGQDNVRELCLASLSRQLFESRNPVLNHHLPCLFAGDAVVQFDGAVSNV